MPKRFAFLIIALVALVALPVLAGSGTFSNPSPISIPASGTGPAAASPFPSPITVSGLTGPISDVNVTVHGYSHTWPGDVQIVLAGPGGRTVALLSAPIVGWGADAVNATVTFDDQASAAVTAPVVSGTFQPTQVIPPMDLGIAGGPVLPFGAALSDFNGANPNGSWSLYVYDRSSQDTGSIAGGWSIEVITAEAGTPAAMTCHPPVTANAVVGSLPADTQVYYEPGNQAPDLVLSAGTYHVLGVDESGQFYAVVLGCDRLWVPVATMVPNTNPDDALWFGHPLPTTVVGA